MSFEVHIITSDTADGSLLYLSLFCGTFLHEGATIAAGAALLVAQQSSMLLTATALVTGIVTGDLGVHGLGALARRSKWLHRRLDVSAPGGEQPLLGNRLIPIVAMCRVVPGMLFPTFLSYGWRGVPFRRFAMTTIAVTLLYVPALLTLFAQLGLQMAQMFQHWPPVSLIALPIVATASGGGWLWARRRQRFEAPQRLLSVV